MRVVVRQGFYCITNCIPSSQIDLEILEINFNKIAKCFFSITLLALINDIFMADLPILF